MAYDQSIIAAIRREAQRVSDPRKRDRYLRAALQTGIVESGIRNLDYGDADSKGWRQERQSLYANPTNVRASVRRFFQEAAQHDRGQPSWELAADVQRPAEQYRGRYKDVAKEAAKLAGGRSSSRSGSSTSTTTSTTPGTVSTSSVTTGGQLPQLSLPERERPTVTAPALPEYVRNPPPTVTLPDRSAPQASLREQIAALGNVPETTTEQTVQTPSTSETTTRTSSSSSRSKGGTGSEIKELFWQGPGGINIKNGQRVPQGFVEGHTGHVHVAAGPETVVALGKVAQKRFGLRVGENPYFEQVDPVHTEGSYHYREGRTKSGKKAGQAIDVSGDPKQMAAFARYVANYAKTRRLPS